ncbi:MAG: hypothetical protein JXB04_13220 [Kiritimatiellae bacterium]|nr:hypothetical protein [Kiritimatiellia bacterium]
MSSKMMIICLVSAVALSAGLSAMAQETYKAPKADLPLVLYGNCEDETDQPYIPSGWMGNTDAIEMDECWPDKPHSAPSCMKFTYSDVKGWGGVVWQSPADDWGDEPGGWDITGAKRLVFWARGDKGEEMVEFKMGILGKNKAYPDSAKASLGKVKLGADWQEFSIPLEGKDLSVIKTGFVWVIAGRKEPVTFYLDDVRFE